MFFSIVAINMSTADVNVSVLVDSKKAYTEKLIEVVAPHIYNDFYDMQNEAIAAIEHSWFPDKSQQEVFSDILKKVKRWDEDETVLSAYSSRLLNECEYLMNLLKTIMVLNTMVLAAIRNKQDSQQVNVELPHVNTFVHQLYKQVATNIKPALFCALSSENEEKVEKAEEKLMSIVEKSIHTVIKSLLPMKHLISTYMQNWDTGEFVSDDRITSPLPTPPIAIPEPVPTPVMVEDETPDSCHDDDDNEDNGSEATPVQEDANECSSDDDDDESESLSAYEQQLMARARQIEQKMRKLKLREKKKKNSRVPIGKVAVSCELQGDQRKMVKLSKNSQNNQLPMEYLGNDNVADDRSGEFSE